MPVISMKKTMPKQRLIPMANRKLRLKSFEEEPRPPSSGSSGSEWDLWRLT